MTAARRRADCETRWSIPAAAQAGRLLRYLLSLRKEPPSRTGRLAMEATADNGPANEIVGDDGRTDHQRAAADGRAFGTAWGRPAVEGAAGTAGGADGRAIQQA